MRWKNSVIAGLLLGLTMNVSANDRIAFNGQSLFLSGLNLAWASFADDVGPNTFTPNVAHFTNVFEQMEANGANSMRLWLHTNGANTPTFSGSTVTGPGSNTIADLETLLDVAWDHKIGLVICLWSFDMMRTSYGPTITGRSEDLLTNQTCRSSYINNSLIPMVQALQGHPAIIAWEIFNEPEGMSNEFGWTTTQHVPMSDIQAFINQCGGAIHRADPAAKVTNGSWSFFATTDVGAGNFNYYTDARLVAAGGDADGTLDFYTVHYYDWAGTTRSPFNQPASHWNLDKPLVVAEFYPNCANCTATSYETLYQNGYAGALAWSWTDTSPSAMLAHINAISTAHPGDVLIVESVAPTVSITSPTNGATFPVSATVSITVDASAATGSLTKVEFFADAMKIGEDVSSPYQYAWMSPASGFHDLTAVATDDGGRVSTSAVVQVFISSPPPVVRLEAEDATYTGQITEESSGAASAGAYLDMQNSGSITWTLPPLAQAEVVDLVIGYNLNYDTPKAQTLSVNSGTGTEVLFSAQTEVWLEKTVSVSLNSGVNQITIEKSWGWMYFDYIEFETGASETNTAPVLTAVPDRTIDAGWVLLLTNEVTDAEAPPQNLNFNLVRGPAGSSLDPMSGVFQWRALVGAGSTTNPVIITVSDDGTPSLSATGSFHIAVNPVAPPVLKAIAANDNIRLEANGPMGPDYQLQATTNYVNWEEVQTVPAPSMPVTLVDTNPLSLAPRMYRIELAP